MENDAARDESLSFVSSANLWKELSTRHNSAIFICNQESGSEGSEVGLFVRGTHSDGLGLVEYARIMMQEVIRDQFLGDHTADDETGEEL